MMDTFLGKPKWNSIMSLAEKYLVQTLKETISQYQYLLGLSPGARMASYKDRAN